jgi:hypothetical protein
MRAITEQTMLKIEEILGKTVFWTAAIHAEVRRSFSVAACMERGASLCG